MKCSQILSGSVKWGSHSRCISFNNANKMQHIMKLINLSQGMSAMVDDEDYDALNQNKWYAMKRGNTFYAVRGITVDGKRKTQYMHQTIMNGKGIDHIEHDGLDNQRSNLRFCTTSENAMNSRKHKNTSSIYKGVSFFKRAGKWMARIRINGKLIHLGYFTDEVEAAKAYDNKAKILFGEFAVLNLY